MTNRAVWNLPNMLTLSRVLMVPFVVVAFYLPYRWGPALAAVFFLFAAITDFFDGYLARKWQQTSAFGAFLDPVADKLMVAVALVLLVELHATLLLAIPACVIICREITVSALREWMAELGKRNAISVSALGKLKTTFQMIAITGLLAIRPSWVPEMGLFTQCLYYFSYAMLYFAMLLTLWSMVLYLRAAWPEISK